MINPYLGLGLAVNNIGIINKNFSNSKDDLPTSILVSTFYQPTYFPGVLFCDVYKQKPHISFVLFNLAFVPSVL